MLRVNRLCRNELLWSRLSGYTGFPSCRHVLSMMGFLVFVSLYTLRVNLSVPIIVMVRLVNATDLRELRVNTSEYELRATDDNCSTLSTHTYDDDDVRIANVIQFAN